MIVVRQRALPRLRKVALGVEQDGEGVEAIRSIRMLRAKR